MDGFEAARRIRAVEKTRSLSPATVIAVTGLGSAEALQKAHASGMVSRNRYTEVMLRNIKPFL